MDKSTLITLILRHLLTAIGGGLAVKYGIDGDTINAAAGGLATAGGVVWSIWEKRQR